MCREKKACSTCVDKRKRALHVQIKGSVIYMCREKKACSTCAEKKSVLYMWKGTMHQPHVRGKKHTYRF